MSASFAKVRFQKSRAYYRAEKRLRKSGTKQKRIDDAWKQIFENPDSHGRKFEPIAGRKGIWKFRLTQQWHVVLREEKDAEGTYFVAVGIEDHDDY